MADKPFHTLSGPWTGWSIQDGFRISERMSLTITKGGTGASVFRMFAEGGSEEKKVDPDLISIRGWGTDADGDFALDGFYEPVTDKVHLIRRYIRSPKMPSQVGYPYIYDGKWNGYCVYGNWCASTAPDNCGPFEMWPEGEEETEELMFERNTESLTLPALTH